MAWQNEMVGLLRVMVNDMEATPVYSDLRLQQTIVAGTQLMLTDASVFSNYSANYQTIEIAPDPTDRVNGTRNDDLVNLALLKAACMIDMGEARQSAKKSGYAIKEFQSSIDMKGAADARIKIMEIGWCKTYEEAIFSFLAGNAALGRVVMTPFRTAYSSYSTGYGYGYSSSELFSDNRRTNGGY